ncbi:hypothetical protein M436DRAFT_80628 [Aureobasidium namibiae CBS 147.97]|uniref:Uncharacterized protein n=1 Tax=Aureobasidium namibiae CBS 147.97 TaxID=1043004 RepID=A0A074WM47_9PEZI|nr:uncharacterized protein M436DRAFT_80628 [Aureobasidium namibiae CBS 147.97]KEQ74175.1 hypothetical protein M436DRAFT_80628 [Aureobasidium namibiae CBS 147.97]
MSSSSHLLIAPSAELLAITKYRESMALQNLETSRCMSTAEAIMASRHKGACDEALRLAPPSFTDSPVLLATFNSYNHDYELDIPEEVVAHASSFWCAYRDRSPILRRVERVAQVCKPPEVSYALLAELQMDSLLLRNCMKV